MNRSWSNVYSPRRVLLAVTASICGTFIYIIWFGMNSDRDNVHPLITQLIPAGHCTCQTANLFQCADCLTCHVSSSDLMETENRSDSAWRFEYGRDDRNLGLSQGQCQASFPGLFQDINRGVEYWKSRGGASMDDDFNTVRLENGMAQARIENGELYVMATRAKGEDHRRKIIATLASIYRALSASDRTLQPNIEFIFSVEDRVDDIHANGHPIWVLSRKASEESVFLMPDFGYWSWEHLNNDIGPFGQVVEQVIATELSFANIEKKLVWRGKLSFAPKLRRTLLDITRNKPWGDVKELVWGRKANLLSMEDHCPYMFIGHVEAHKLQYIQHHHHYLLVSSGLEQNYVEVERDFSDLPDRMDELLKSPEKAERIADNSVKTFRERYLTHAAEACYWRALWEGWAEVSLNASVGKPTFERGLRYESFVLRNSKDMLDFSFGLL